MHCLLDICADVGCLRCRRRSAGIDKVLANTPSETSVAIDLVRELVAPRAHVHSAGVAATPSVVFAISHTGN